MIGAALVDLLGFEGFTIALGAASFVLAVPAFAVAAISSRAERDAAALPVAVSEEVPA